MKHIYRQVWAEVDLSAFKANICATSSLISKEVGIILAIKADGYGIGAIQAARYVEDMPQVIGYAVASPEEALVLREAGVGKCILVLGPTDYRAKVALAQSGVSMTVASLEEAREAIAVGKDMGGAPKIHLKIETGMGRIGMDPGRELLDFIRLFTPLPQVMFEGVYTHLSSADTDRPYSLLQIERFRQALAKLESAGLRPKIRHAANSAAIYLYPEAHFDAVRPGIMLYGSPPTRSLIDKVQLRPVMSLVARVCHVKRVPTGASIGYGRAFAAPTARNIATLPVGYADGYPRSLSGKGLALIGGRRHPIAGRVCMDLTMVDVGQDEVAPGDLAVLFGHQDGAAIEVIEVAELAETISQDILTGIGHRVPRIYTG